MALWLTHFLVSETWMLVPHLRAAVSRDKRRHVAECRISAFSVELLQKKCCYISCANDGSIYQRGLSHAEVCRRMLKKRNAVEACSALPRLLALEILDRWLWIFGWNRKSSAKLGDAEPSSMPKVFVYWITCGCWTHWLNYLLICCGSLAKNNWALESRKINKAVICFDAKTYNGNPWSLLWEALHFTRLSLIDFSFTRHSFVRYPFLAPNTQPRDPLGFEGGTRPTDDLDKAFMIPILFLRTISKVEVYDTINPSKLAIAFNFGGRGVAPAVHGWSICRCQDIDKVASRVDRTGSSAKRQEMDFWIQRWPDNNPPWNPLERVAFCVSRRQHSAWLSFWMAKEKGRKESWYLRVVLRHPFVLTFFWGETLFPQDASRKGKWVFEREAARDSILGILNPSQRLTVAHFCTFSLHITAGRR